MNKDQGRDLSHLEFHAKARRHGFKYEALGYWRLAPPCQAISVNQFNAGTRRRAQLAYLIKSQQTYENMVRGMTPTQPEQTA